MSDIIDCERDADGVYSPKDKEALRKKVEAPRRKSNEEEFLDGFKKIVNFFAKAERAYREGKRYARGGDSRR